MLDLLRIADGLSCVSDVTDMAGLGEKINLGDLSCLMWLCSDKLTRVVQEIQTQAELAEKVQKLKDAQQQLSS